MDGVEDVSRSGNYEYGDNDYDGLIKALLLDYWGAESTPQFSREPETIFGQWINCSSRRFCLGVCGGFAEPEDTHRAIHGAALGRLFCDNNSTKSEPGINCRQRTIGSSESWLLGNSPVLPRTIQPHNREWLKFTRRTGQRYEAPSELSAAQSAAHRYVLEPRVRVH